MGGAYQEDNIHPHFTGNDKGLYATMIGGSIDPWLYGAIFVIYISAFSSFIPSAEECRHAP